MVPNQPVTHVTIAQAIPFRGSPISERYAFSAVSHYFTAIIEIPQQMLYRMKPIESASRLIDFFSVSLNDFKILITTPTLASKRIEQAHNIYL